MWNKKSVTKNQLEPLQKKFALDPISASIFARRGITDGKEILYFMEDDLRFQHNPFLFSQMEDVVDRILAAVPDEETPDAQKEKVLIFGDRDVDGVTATTLLYEELRSLGIDAEYKVPEGDDAYGLSVQAVEDFEKKFGSLIITVDCGIANVQEISLAAEKGMDVIVLDHHNPQEILPSPALILDAHLENSGYPFKNISGCALAYKVAGALRFSRSRWYKADTAILNARKEDKKIFVECVKLRNLVPVARLVEEIVPGEKSISETKLPKYLQDQIILCWDKKNLVHLLHEAFGDSAEFNVADIRDEIAKFYPSLKNAPLSAVKMHSKIAKYGDHEPTEIGGFYNIFVTYVQQNLKKEFPQDAQKEDDDLQLVALAALADIMPMKNENRLFVKHALKSINGGKIRGGLKELFCALNFLGRRITSTDLSWTIVPNLNSCGRLGEAGTAMELFTASDENARMKIAKKIVSLNLKRKELTQSAAEFSSLQAKKSIQEFSNRLCFVWDDSGEKINRGITGILAQKLMTEFGVPSIAMTKVNDKMIGSIRSPAGGLNATEFLGSDEIKNFFVSFGGHDSAAGFTILQDDAENFRAKVKILSQKIQPSEQEKIFSVDAELPREYMTTEIQKIVDRFEPYGDENPKLIFLAKNLPVSAGTILGKSERQHLKITVDCGSAKWPCIFWGEGEKLHRDFDVGDKVDILFNVERNLFNGCETLQLMLLEIEKSKI
jgi:single-stranded-DNA-specific exonuclease